MSRGVIVLAIVVVVIVVALISISFPSVVISSVSTRTLPAFETYTSQYETGYAQPTSSTALAGYSTATAWYPGNFLCDPTSNACSPYPTPTATIVYPQSITSTYQITLSSQTTSTFTSEFTLFSNQTGYETIPPYAAAGLTEFQYGIIIMGIVVALGLGFLFFVARKRALIRPSATKLDSAKTAKFCQHCGTANAEESKFCTGCGVPLS